MRVNKKQEVCFAEMPERPVQRKAIFSLRHAASALGLPGPQANSVTGPPRQGSLRTKAQHRGKRVGLSRRQNPAALQDIAPNSAPSGKAGTLAHLSRVVSRTQSCSRSTSGQCLALLEWHLFTFPFSQHGHSSSPLDTVQSPAAQGVRTPCSPQSPWAAFPCPTANGPGGGSDSQSIWKPFFLA